MPIRIPSLMRESNSQAKFRIHLDAAVRSAAPGARVDVVAMEAMVNLVRSKEVNPGEALSCFKTDLREGTPDEQHRALLVLAQFVGTDPHLGNLLHMELASKRWRERFVQLAQSPHPDVKPLLISTLQGWAASYRAHDIGIHYQATLREIEGGAFRGGGYAAQHTGYSTQYTGYSAQATGAGGYPPGPPPPSGYPTAGTPVGYPPYGAPYGAAAVPAPYPPAPQPSFGRNASPADVSNKLDQLSSEVEQLRGAIRAFEAALADYKAQRAPFAALSGALERGQRTADRCSSLQVQIENLVGHSDGGDEGLMARLFSTNDSAVAALEQWKRLSNQELAPEDAAPGASSPAGAAAAAAPAAAPPPPPPKPAPTPLDLLLGDEIINPTPTPQPPPRPAFANGTGAGPSGYAAPAAAASAAAVFDAFSAAAAGPSAGAVTLPPSTPVVPASDMEGLRAQVLALSADLDKQRKVHVTAMEAQEAFHRGELAQAKARIAELEATLARQQSGGAAAAPAAPAPAPYGNAYGAPFGVSAPIPASVFPPMPTTAPAAVSNNPFATFVGPVGGYGSAPPPAPSAAPAAAPPAAAMGSLQLNMTVPPQPPAPAPAPAGDIMNAFDELAAATSLKASGGGGGAPVPMAAVAPQPTPAAAPAAAAPGGAGAGAGSWVNFGH
ncbi:hypothetical protein CHLRE_06g302600v5 [Chlamydomonas reinhardtii]|uniref:VHS domain-containing protein n=1 Tax=Chlamydomonas reinhardtii TaxID=3055 RepID=A0A2K3DR27_CHLRE|nr:uncharacterized protein CHLRE_06g302600v5 [Chlamydomonas reinhardtii]PNW83002.1 hypothetical protein CHLRE_06g302600v5 [Chlamydomonas reinhardtii]